MTESLEINEDKIIEKISAKLQVRPSHIKSALNLMKEGGTVHFIARYRKEFTGSMDEEQLRVIKDDYESLKKTEERRIVVLQSIRTQEKFQALDEKKRAEYENKILNAKTLTEIEDLYLPYKPKRKTLATKALEKGLGPLAEIIRQELTEGDRDEIIARFVTTAEKPKEKKDKIDDLLIKKPLRGEALKKAQEEEKEKKKKTKAKDSLVVKTPKEALDGAMDIIAEDVGQNAEFRKYVREICFKESIIVSKVRKEYAHIANEEENRKAQEEKKAEEEKKKREEEEKRKAALEKKLAKMTESERKIFLLKEQIRQQKEEQKQKEEERKKRKEAELLKKQKKQLKSLGMGDSEELGKKEVNPYIYEMYFDFKQKAFGDDGIPPHRVLAINRGEKEKVLSVSWEHPEDEILNYMKSQLITKPESLFLQEYAKAIEYGFRRYIVKAIEREMRGELTKNAEEHAINIFAKNLKAYLMQPPLRGKPIIALDPGFAHGTKTCVIDEFGNFKEDTIILKYEKGRLSNQERQRAERTLIQLMMKYNVRTFAIGNGTASRETENFIASLAKKVEGIEYLIVNEAGASVYSASKLAAEEFPDLSVEARGAISIARRVQDPLSELIKIDPKSIGVGLYQHDVNQSLLKKSLDETIEDCVNSVGVLVNSASYKLLEYVSGLNKRLARAIYNYRIEHSGIKSREELKNIPGIGAKVFEQCAGFIKIKGGDNPLDGTIIHPESYWVVEKILEFIGEKPEILADPSRRGELSSKIKRIKPKELIDFMGKDIGLPTLKDIVIGLLKPDRDPRDDLPPPILKSDVLHLEDLKPGDILKGTVRNVVDFGAFVDIGVHEDGLVHISEMVRKDGKGRFIEDPTEILQPGDIIDVRVIKVDLRKKRIQLSMRLEGTLERKKESTRKESGGFNKERENKPMSMEDQLRQMGMLRMRGKKRT